MKFYLLLLSIVLLNACSPLPDKPLKETYWSLSELRGEEPVQYERHPQIHLLFHINNASLHGSDGCNRIKGTYVQKEGSFHFGPLASTMMYCEDGMKQSNDFLQVLQETDRIQITGNTLILFHADIEIARFEAKNDY